MKFFKACIALLLCVFVASKYTYETHVSTKIMDTFMDKPAKEIFKAFHFVFNRANEYSINSEIGLKRYKIFKANLNKINSHNAKNLSWSLGINQFTDLTKEEFAQRYLMKETDVQEEKQFFNSFNLDEYDDSQDDSIVVKKNDGLFEEIDHRPFFTPARQQAQCGSCWSFTTAAALEANFSKDLILPPFNLSTQQQVDCNPNCNGCNGGSGPGGMKYAMQGLVAETDYPYQGVKGTCDTAKINDPKVRKYKASRFESVTNQPIEKWVENLRQGAMYVRVDGMSLYSYRKGIIRFSVQNTTADACKGTNHAVTAAGIGYDNQELYVLIRNSWGTSWGENGNFRAYFEPTQAALNTCFLTQYGYRPVPNTNDGH